MSDSYYFFFVTRHSSRSSLKITPVFQGASVLLSVFAKSARNFGARTILGYAREKERPIRFRYRSQRASGRKSRGARTLRGTRIGTTCGACRARLLAQVHKYLCAMDERTKCRDEASAFSSFIVAIILACRRRAIDRSLFSNLCLPALKRLASVFQTHNCW